MKLLVVDNAQKSDADFNQPLFDLVSSQVDCDVVNYLDLPDYQTIRASYDAVVLSGVPIDYSFASIDKRASYYNWITATDMPVLGICLGHQVIGELFGGTIIAQRKPEIGLKMTRVKVVDPLLKGIGRSFKNYTMHRAAVTLPPDFMILASTRLCKNTIMRHKTRNIYGLQFHPELSTHGAALLNNFISIVRQTTAVEELAIQPTARPLVV